MAQNCSTRWHAYLIGTAFTFNVGCTGTEPDSIARGGSGAGASPNATLSGGAAGSGGNAAGNAGKWGSTGGAGDTSRSTISSTDVGGRSAGGGSVAVGGQSGSGGSAPRDSEQRGGATSQGGASSTGGNASVGGASSSVYRPAFIIGADVTITLEDEYYGATYTDGGRTKPLELLLKDHGFNFIRLDTFVNPAAAGGYAEGKVEAFRDLTHTITLAKRVKAAGLGFLLDIHYSDTWTNPSQQSTPAEWSALNLSALEAQVYDYTKNALEKLRAAGAMPDIVQVGNETTNGMLWPLGRIINSNFDSFSTLLKAGIRAVRELDPAILVMLHIEKCHDTKTTRWWLDGVLGEQVSFDVLGQSCYATAPNGVAGYQGTPAQWQSTFQTLASAYPNLRFMIAEYSAEQRAAHDVMFGLPSHRGLGAINWDPTRAYATHPNHPLFTTNGAWNRYVAVPELLALYDKMAVDYRLR